MIKSSSVHIAFLGPSGSYSHIAAMQYANYYFNNQIIEYSCPKFSDILSVVTNHKAEYGILPIENSDSGFINEVCNLLLNTQLKLVGEIIVPIKHYILVTNPNHISLEKIQFILSHPQPIQQCSKFLRHFSTKWKIILCQSSSKAIKTVAKLNQPNLAALGSVQGGLLYGLKPLPSISNVSNHYQNNTRFIILKDTKNVNTINTTTYPCAKTMIILFFKKKLKSIHLILTILNIHGIHMTCLKSHTLTTHPIMKNIVIIELIANLNDIHIQQALMELRKISHSLKILGCYPMVSQQ